MKGFWSSSIGKKLIMSLSGLFLIVFLLVHLSLNFTMVLDTSGEMFNKAAHFMATNAFIKILEPILALGFIIHIIYGIIVQLNNWKARGNNNYAVTEQKHSSTWSSRNMIYLGIVVFAFLVIHIINFYWQLKVTHNVGSITIDGVEMHDTFKLVTTLFGYWWYDVIYIVGFIALGLHLHHAFWSALQTLGWNNEIWRKRLQTIGDIYAWVIAVGFSIIPLYYYFFN